MWRQTLLDVHQKGLIGGQAIANKKSNGKLCPPNLANLLSQEIKMMKPPPDIQNLS
jgi:hypothetical protein